MTIIFFAVIVVPIWWKDGVGKNSVLFAHVSEPIVFVWWIRWKKGVLFASVEVPGGHFLAGIRICGSVPLNYGSGFGSGSGLYRTILTLLSVEERCSF